LEPAVLGTAESWIAERRTQWERKLDRLGEFLAEEAEVVKPEPRKKKP
jgi:hypothetical protein